MLVAVLAVSLAGVVRAAPTFAALGDLPVITYNMQGATSGLSTKWTTNIVPLTHRAQIVALQEAGPSGPPSAPGTAAAPVPLVNADADQLPQIGAASQVIHSQWRVGHANLDVYFLQTDRNSHNGQPTYVGGRVNLAMVTQRAADAVAALPNPINGGRATLGLLFGTTWYFDVHAFSGGGGDAPGLLQSINTFVQGRGLGETWAAIGDFNRTPDSLRQAGVPAGATVHGQGMPTQQSGRELDYAVFTGADQNNLPRVTRLAGASADHYAVGFGLPATTATPTQIFTSQATGDNAPQTIESMQTGGVLDANDQNTENFTPVDAFRRNDQANQSWTVNAYLYADGTTAFSFQGTQSNRCIDIQHSDRNPRSGRRLSLFDCNNGTSQQWVPVYEGNDEYELQSLLRPGLCMNIRGGQSNPNKTRDLIVYTCQNTSNERWIFTQAYVPSTGTLAVAPIIPPVPVTVETARDGGVMDVSQNRTADNSPVISFHRIGQANQGWDIEPSTSGGEKTVAFRGVESSKCLDILNSTSVTPGQQTVIFGCTGQPSQQWLVDPQDNGTVAFENALYPSLCLDVSGNPVDPDVGNLDVYTCNGQANQEWYFTSWDPFPFPFPDSDLPDDSGSNQQ